MIFDHDGGTPDDFIALTLLTRMPNVELRGVVVSPGVSFSEPAVNVSRKLLDLAGSKNVSVAKSTSRGLNPFPAQWRRKAYIADALPILNQQSIHAPLAAESGAQFLVRLLSASKQQVSILSTGPLSTISEALKLQPAIASKISQIVWMGGALQVAGNVSPSDEPSHDGTAEWNVYFDPIAASEIWKTKIPIVLCPLDTTNQVPVTEDFIRKLAAIRQFPLADFAGQIMALPFADGGSFYFWDAVAASWLGKPEIFRTAEWEVGIVSDGPSQGRMIARPNSGRKIKVLEKPDVPGFQSYLLQLLATKK